MDYPSHAREICPYCSRSFSAHRYKAHLFNCAAHDLSSEDPTVQCAYCPAFVQKENLKKHYRKCPGAVVCTVCEEATSIEKAEEHASQHSQACPYCYVEFPVTALPVHTSHCGRFPAQSEPQVANCEHCKRTVGRAYIREHLEECEKAEQCPVCFGFFSRREIDDHTQACALQVSMDRQAQVTCPICQQQVSQHAMEDHLRTHEAVPSFSSPPSNPDIIYQSGENGYKSFSYEELQREKLLLEQESVERRLEDYSFGPENYEELLKLDDSKYEPGQGLKSMKINRLVQYANQVSGEECPICKCPLQVQEMVKRLPCMHVFHSCCIDEWLGRKPTCPVDNMEVRLG